MRDGQATRRRILDAATAEFAAHGIAGARVDRIATTAKANKAQMYAYFGSKDGLFDSVLDEHLDAIVAAVPPSVDDLPGYAVRLYDEHMRRPQFVRLAAWARLERVPSGDLFGERAGQPERLAAQVAKIAEAQAHGRIDSELRAEDVFSLVIALAMTWSPISLTVAGSAGDAAAEHERRRDAVRRAVSRVTSGRAAPRPAGRGAAGAS